MPSGPSQAILTSLWMAVSLTPRQLDLPGMFHPLMAHAVYRTREDFTAILQLMTHCITSSLSCALAESTEENNHELFGGGSSSSLRGFITHWLMNTTTEDCNDSRDLEELFSLPGLPGLHVCSSNDTSSGPYL